MKAAPLIRLCLIASLKRLDAFSVKPRHWASTASVSTEKRSFPLPRHQRILRAPSTPLGAVTADLDTVALVAGQENYGLAVVVVGEALWSFFQAPSLSHARILVPAAVAVAVLVAISGPMVTSGDAGSVALGLEIAAIVSALLGASYIARLVAPYSPSPKEIAFLGLLIAVAGFFSFSQNLVVDGFVTLPNLPSINLPQIPLGLGDDLEV